MKSDLTTAISVIKEHLLRTSVPGREADLNIVLAHLDQLSRHIERTFEDHELDRARIRRYLVVGDGEAYDVKVVFFGGNAVGSTEDGDIFLELSEDQALLPVCSCEHTAWVEAERAEGAQEYAKEYFDRFNKETPAGKAEQSREPKRQGKET